MSFQYVKLKSRPLGGVDEAEHETYSEAQALRKLPPCIFVCKQLMMSLVLIPIFESEFDQIQGVVDQHTVPSKQIINA